MDPNNSDQNSPQIPPNPAQPEPAQPQSMQNPVPTPSFVQSDTNMSQTLDPNSYQTPQVQPPVNPVQQNDFTSVVPPVQNINPVNQTQPVSQPQPPAPAENPTVNPVQSVSQPIENTPPVLNTYIDDIGEDLIDLLDEISENDSMLKMVADEMKLDPNNVKTLLTTVLNKIDNEQITTEDLALIMAATVADAVPQTSK